MVQRARDGEGETAAPMGVLAADRVQLDAPQAARDIRDAALIKEGDLFLLTDVAGNIPRDNSDGFGLYRRDMRFLSTYELSVQGLLPTILLSGSRFHFLGTQVLTNPNLVTPDGRIAREHTIQIRRYRLVRPDETSESLTFQNYNGFALTLDVAIHLDADFADIFEVRGIVRVSPRGPVERTTPSEGVIAFRCDGLDGVRRRTTARFDPPPRSIEGGVARYQLTIAAAGSTRLAVTVAIDEGPVDAPRALDPRAAPRAGPSVPFGAPGPRAAGRPGLARPPLAGYKRWLESFAQVESSNNLFNATLRQAQLDLRTLLSGDDDAPYFAAGIPWYAALFGRDSLITALFTLWASPVQAKHALRLLAAYQGTRDDPTRDEEPGKILHELRLGEVAARGLAPFTPYYGSADATPLWVLLLAEHHRTTGDASLARELRPNLDAAIAWIDVHGDRDGDGFVEYLCRSSAGLVNQGWKDSSDAIAHHDGSLATGPIALVEVQAYVFAARRGAARLYRALGDPASAAAQDVAAERLRARFEDAFWMPSEGFYALALDGDKRQVAVISSNAGHALFAGIASPERGASVARRLLDEDLHSGFGVRTLSTREARYNPTGYHVGTVWPHDNAMLALGMKRYREEARALELVGGMLDAAQQFPAYRMPELFCGFARSAFGAPVRYPVACSPQAWAAASWSAFAQVMLGVRANAPARELTIVRPRLPSWLRWVELARVPVGEGEVDLRYERVGEHTAVDVVAMRGDVRVAFVEDWEDG